MNQYSVSNQLSDLQAVSFIPTCRDGRTLREPRHPSTLPHRRRLVALREQLNILSEYHAWPSSQQQQAWRVAVRMLKAGSKIGAILAHLDHTDSPA